MQKLNHKVRGEFVVVRTWAGPGRTLAEFPNGTFGRLDGNPVQSEQELLELIPPGKSLERALAWWERRHDPVPSLETRTAAFRQGALVWEDTGEPLTSFPEVLEAFPEPGPFQTAALEYISQRFQQSRAFEAGQQTLLDPKLNMLQATAEPEPPPLKPGLGLPPPGSRLARKLTQEE